MIHFLFPPPLHTQAVKPAIPATEHMQVTVLADASYLSFFLLFSQVGQMLPF